MRIRKRITGWKFAFGGVAASGWIPSGASQPKPTPVENTLLELRIESDEPGSVFLYWESSNPNYVSSDSWHQTLENALEVAEKTFGVRVTDWSDA